MFVDCVWPPLSLKLLSGRHPGNRAEAPTTEVTAFRALQVDMASLESWLSEVPTGKAFEATRSTWVLKLPMPDGAMERFSVLNSPVMAPALAARYPEIQVFAGQDGFARGHGSV